MAAVVVYSKNRCPYCDRAKALLKRKGVAYTEINVEEHPDKLPEMLARSEGRRTFPQIIINDKAVGGSDDIHALDREGKLDQLLAG
ncbi:MAG: glutaredoxin 3 [Methylobacteriaceae bacterium]|jgi:glutaredoxin 3|nr:glutaredoxin 3 [Methylobacteriaceae bacterium]